MSVIFFGYSSNYKVLRLSSLGYPAGTVYRGEFDSSDDPTHGGTVHWKGYFNPHATQINQVIIEDEISLDYANNLFDGLVNCTEIRGINNIRGNLLNTTRMFADTPKLTQDLTFSNMISINCLDATEMFANSGFKNIVLDNINMKNCISMRGMFKNAKAQTVEMTSINTQSVRYADEMFSGCSNLTAIYATGGYFDFAQSITSNNMFDGANLLTNYPNKGTDKNGAISIDLGGYINMSPNSLEMVDVRIQLKYDTHDNWFYYDPVPLEGELCIESDSLKFKVGDGSHHYSELDYMYGFKIDHDTIIEDSETFELKVPIDEDTIILEDGKLKSVEKLHADQITIMSDSEGLLFLDLDDRTIRVSATGELESVTPTDNRTIKEGATGLYVPIDQATIYIDPADNLLKSRGDLTPGKGLEWNASSARVLDVKIDGKTLTTTGHDGPSGSIAVSYDGQTIYWDAGAGDNGALKAKGVKSSDQSVTVTTSGHDYDLSLPLDNDTIVLDGGVIKATTQVPEVDNVTVVLDSSNKLSVPIDNDTIFVDGGKVKSKGTEPDNETIIISEGKLKVSVDNKTIIYNEVSGELEAPLHSLTAQDGLYVQSSENGFIIGTKVDNNTIFVNSNGELEGAPNVLVDDKTIKNSEGIISANIDNETIVYNPDKDWLEVTNRILQTENGIYAREDSEVLFIGVLSDDKTFKANSEGFLGVNIDNDTIVYNNSKDWIEVPNQFVEFENGIYVTEGSEGIKVGANVDNKTIFINSEGQIEGAPNVLVDGITIVQDSENVISVPIDHETIIYNPDQEWIEVNDKDIEPESGIYFRDTSETLYIGVDIDGETLFINSEGKLAGAPNVLVDGTTIIQDDNDVISVHYDHDTIVYNSEVGLQVDGIDLTPISPIYIKENSEAGTYMMGCGYDNTTITLNENNELQTAVGGGWRYDPEEKIIATGTNVPKKRHHMLPDDDADYYLETVWFPNPLHEGKEVQAKVTHDAAFMDETVTLKYVKEWDVWYYDGRYWDSEGPSDHPLNPHGYSIFVQRNKTVVQLHEDFDTIAPATLTCTITYGGHNVTKEYIDNQFVLVDNDTIFVNNDGELEARLQLEAGDWIQISEGIVGMGKLCQGLGYNKDSNCIYVKDATDSEVGGVKIDNETLKVNDQGQLAFDLDGMLDRGLDATTGKIGHTNEFSGDLRQAGDPTSTLGIKWDDQGHLQEVERYDIPTYLGASAFTDGKRGLVPAASSANRKSFLRGDGTWANLVDANLFSVIQTTGQWYVGTDRRSRVFSADPSANQLVIAPLGWTIDRDVEGVDVAYATEMTLGHITLVARSNSQAETVVRATCYWLVLNL